MPVKETKLESKTGAALAGAGGGTLLALVGAKWPETDPLKTWIIYAIPTVSVLLSAVWLWAQLKIANYFQDIQVRSLIDEARTILETALANPNTSDEHKLVLRQELEALELVDVNRIMERVKSVETVTASDIEGFYAKHQDSP